MKTAKTEKLQIAARVGMCGGLVVGKVTRKGHLKVYVSPSGMDDQEPRYSIIGMEAMLAGLSGHYYTTDSQAILARWVVENKFRASHLHGTWWLVRHRGQNGLGLFRKFERMLQAFPNWNAE
jgi:hypothetical protein